MMKQKLQKKQIANAILANGIAQTSQIPTAIVDTQK